MLLHNSTHRYNLLFIMCDQLRADAVGYNNPLVYTPNIDRLASESLIFDNHFVQSPQCCPSRASLLSGEYPSNINMYWNDSIFKPSSPCLGNYFDNAGYTTAYFGKFHVQSGIQPNQFVSNVGFKQSYLYNNWINDNKGKPSYEAFMSAYNNRGLVGAIEDENKQHDHIITHKTINFINQSKRPYFAFLSYHGPHAPYSSPDRFKKLYNDSPLLNQSAVKKPGYYTRFDLNKSEWSDLKANYYGCISWIDSMIGTIAEQCDLSNTIVVFTADHGDILGDHGLWDKGLYAYDPVVKVPLLIKVPDIEHVRYPHLTEAVDLVKTLVSHNDLKYNIENQFRHNIISQAVKGNPGRRYVFSAIGKHQPRVRMVRNNQFKYWWGLTAPGHLEYLYNLDDDPGEVKNLAQFDHANLSLMRSILIEALIYSGA